jgi:PhnB protein
MNAQAPKDDSRRVVPYLYFKGDCEAALLFYAASGLGEIKELRRYAGTPMVARHGAEWSDKVLHSVFEGPGIRLCASDGPDSEPMKGCAIFLESADAAGTARLFQVLSVGGRVTVAFQKQFWGDFYGNFTDRFGVQWAMNVPG